MFRQVVDRRSMENILKIADREGQEVFIDADDPTMSGEVRRVSQQELKDLTKIYGENKIQVLHTIPDSKDQMTLTGVKPYTIQGYSEDDVFVVSGRRERHKTSFEVRYVWHDMTIRFLGHRAKLDRMIHQHEYGMPVDKCYRQAPVYEYDINCSAKNLPQRTVSGSWEFKQSGLVATIESNVYIPYRCPTPNCPFCAESIDEGLGDHIPEYSPIIRQGNFIPYEKQKPGETYPPSNRERILKLEQWLGSLLDKVSVLTEMVQELQDKGEKK